MGRIYAEGRQAPKGIIGVMNAEFLATVHCEILCNRDLFNVFTFLGIHSLLFTVIKIYYPQFL